MVPFASKPSYSEPVSILVCTRDRPALLSNLLADLRRQTYAGGLEILVVEETDTPSPPQGVRYLPIPVRNLGIAYARNLAWQHAKHAVVVYVDDDCRVSPEWLGKLVAPFADPTVLGVQGGVTVPAGTSAAGWAETLLGFPGGGLQRVVLAAEQWQATREVSTLNAVYRKAAIVAAGGFRTEAHWGGEDYVLAKQVAEQGTLLFVPEALVRHVAREKWPALWRWFVRRGRAEIALVHAGLVGREYWRYVWRASFALKLAGAGLLSAWVGYAPLYVLLGVFVVSAWWHTRWALRQPEVPWLAWVMVPAVKCIMDVAADMGRLRELWRYAR